MTRSVLWLFVARETRDLRTNRNVWPAYIALAIVCIGLPTAIAFLIPMLVRDALSGREPEMAQLLAWLRATPEFRSMDVGDAMARYLLRSVAGLFLILPVALSSTSAAFSIVGEKQQRTLEPILATPITDREFLFGKLLAAVVPTVAATWLAALLAIGIADALLWSRMGGPILPDRYWLVAVGILSPLLATIVVLVTMRLSAKATDPQATVQATALTVIPGFLLLFALFGRVLTLWFPALLIACALALLLALWLFRTNVRRFEREEILTRWK